MATEENKEQNDVSPASLLSSAKVVAEAAQSALRHDPESLDKAKAADAAADLLDAASHYTKLDQSGYGKYVDKAEDYLHHVKPAPTGAVDTAGDSKEGDKKPTVTAGESEKDAEGGGGGSVDFMKMAQGFLK
ncbi:nodulin-related protein 1-like [Iris pallida]|uniref:Nodulin-related protein 1-like n=1 Tax=Iris pallida TaxID=29817 RepID=A0AAX6IJU0_IRIPA|nr:nodulin-related protein 1-like [Iris pallida]KAJ6853536.1 nodulin-related protein 1-like [Iris pallida]